jgi:hypothetical protein
MLRTGPYSGGASRLAPLTPLAATPPGQRVVLATRRAALWRAGHEDFAAAARHLIEARFSRNLWATARKPADC